MKVQRVTASSPGEVVYSIVDDDDQPIEVEVIHPSTTGGMYLTLAARMNAQTISGVNQLT